MELCSALHYPECRRSVTKIVIIMANCEVEEALEGVPLMLFYWFEVKCDLPLLAQLWYCGQKVVFH